MTDRLANKLIVVTGAARGLGAAIAAACVRDGAHVIVADVLDDEARHTADALGDAAVPWHLDVTDERSWAELADSVVSSGRPLDGLVNNAGLVRGSTIDEATYEDLMISLQVNVGGTFLGIKTFMQLRADDTRPGSIVNIASVRGLIGGARAVTYSASKFGVRGVTKSAAVELGQRGVRVNAVCPGPIESDMSTGNPQFAMMDWDAYTRRLPLGHIGQPIDVAEATVWLLSDASAFITGIDVPVDGGLTATSYSVEPKSN